ncbi:dienelactone hydrolase family protein [Klebsiella sp. BIGb0407]|uniref:dienelactone hydrolase family protein n=1 Tax=Klebsiella sp. BIGb0407 TaxID=2940603 RepID=UPI002169D858|nr:alpha/beta fold hydrolase [Klebsiella sp. BIGb0407]
MLSGSALANTDTWPQSLQNNLPAFYPELKAKMTYPQSWLSGNYSDFSQWQQQTRAQVREALLAPEATVAFAPEILETQDRGSYRAEKMALNITDESRVNALILTPKSPPPYPAIVLLHDHGSKFDIGKEKMIKPWGNEAQLASAQAWADKFFTGQFVGDELAKRGYMVIAIDAPGFGERGPVTYEQQQALASNFYNLGRSLAGTMAYEDMRTVDFLASLPDVDAKRIGALGFSMGAYRAWQLAALSEKVAATAAISWFGNYDGLMTPGNNILRGQSAFYMLHPGLASKLDIPDVASLVAPRPLLIFNGGTDKLFPPAAVSDAYDKVHQVWRSQNQEDHLLTQTWPELGHVFYKEQQDIVFPWLDSWLMK